MRRTKRGGWPYSQPPNVQFEINRISPQADGLVAWWPTLASHGANVLQSIDNRNDGSIPAGWSWTSQPMMGPMLQTDGANDILVSSAAGDSWLCPTDFITVSAWVVLDTLSPADNLPAIIGSTPDAAGDAGWFLAFNNAGNTFRFYVASALFTWEMAESSAVNANTLYNVTGRLLDSGEVAIFVNGIKGPTTDTAAQIAYSGATDPTRIGSYADVHYFEGLIGDVRVNHTGFSDALIWQLQDPATRWELYKPLIRRWLGWKSPITVRIPRYGFTNFQVPGIV